MPVSNLENHPSPSPVTSTKGPGEISRRLKSRVSFILTFVIMFVVWILLSGRFDLFHLSLGVISCLIVSAFAGKLLFPSPDVKKLPGLWFRFIRYIPWLIYQVFVANIHVMYLCFHPKMMELIDPRIVTMKSRLKSDLALVTLANSITLTPGTITVYASTFGEVAF
ncbi:Na+/H+ antiporter subunit E, partial [Thermodesulfobacteriota bacterium]